MHSLGVLFRLFVVAAALLVGILPVGKSWGKGTDGFLRLYHSHNKDFLEIRYLTPAGEYHSRALQKINHFMRSRDSGEVIPINPAVVSLLDRIQDHFEADTVEVISGYRSPVLNNYLRQTGHNVAKESYHMRGWAADIHLDEITELALSRFVRRMNVGGVGYYPDNLMVHVDVGRVNFWQETPFKHRLDIGEFNDKISARLTTDRLFYRVGEEQTLTFTDFERRKFRTEMSLEWFRRGEWKNLLSEPVPPQGRSRLTWKFLPSIPFGKFRWKVSSRDGRFQFSNEFYLKKR